MPDAMKMTALYVEDNPAVLESTCDLLEEVFDQVDTAANGQEGLDAYRAYHEAHGAHYDFVITDINMPVMSGIVMIEQIRQINAEAFVIVVSAHNEAQYLLQLIHLGVTDFLLKPIEIHQFETVMNRVIDTLRTKRQLLIVNAELKAMNESLRHAKTEAEQASKMKSVFLANMSHEIRTPLNAIVGFIALLKEQEREPQKMKYLKVVKDASDTLLQIINDILDISKIESGKLQIEPVDFNPYDDLITVVELFQAKAADKGIALKVNYSNTMPPALHGDLLRIKQILSNLLSNAVKFTPEGGKIKCIISYKKEQLNLRVKDNGIGIPESKQQEIFEAFAQVEGTSLVHGGSGLGLSICIRLAKLLHGSLRLRSKPGKGSTFTLRIPVTPAAVVSEVPIVTDPHKAKGHVLVVEDNATNRMFVGIVLDNAGFTYEMAVDGIEAVEKFKTGRYDVILMDENMPRLGGVEATRQIIALETAESRPHTPIISLTANAFADDRERFLSAGMDDYLGKPVEPERLLATMARHLTPKE